MERRNNNFWPGYWVGYAVGALVFSVLPHITHNPSEDIKNIQKYNQEVTEQISENYPGIESMSLDKSDNFTFVVNQEGQTEQTCSGKYEVNNNVAAAIGDIVCSVSTPIGTTTTTLG